MVEQMIPPESWWPLAHSVLMETYEQRRPAPFLENVRFSAFNPPWQRSPLSAPTDPYLFRSEFEKDPQRYRLDFQSYGDFGHLPVSSTALHQRTNYEVEAAETRVGNDVGWISNLTNFRDLKSTDSVRLLECLLKLVKSPSGGHGKRLMGGIVSRISLPAEWFSPESDDDVLAEISKVLLSKELFSSLLLKNPSMPASQFIEMIDAGPSHVPNFSSLFSNPQTWQLPVEKFELFADSQSNISVAGPIYPSLDVVDRWMQEYSNPAFYRCAKRWHLPTGLPELSTSSVDVVVELLTQGWSDPLSLLFSAASAV